MAVNLSAVTHPPPTVAVDERLNPPPRPAPPHSLVAVPDGVQPVGNGDGRAVGELLLDGCLDEAIGLQIHGGGGLIHDQNLGFPKQSPGQAQ